MDSPGDAAIKIYGTMIHTGLNMSELNMSCNLSPLSNKLKSSLWNRLSELKIVIIDEVSIVYYELLFFVI